MMKFKGAVVLIALSLYVSGIYSRTDVSFGIDVGGPNGGVSFGVGRPSYCYSYYPPCVAYPFAPPPLTYVYQKPVYYEKQVPVYIERSPAQVETPSYEPTKNSDYWHITNTTSTTLTIASDHESRTLKPKQSKGLDREKDFTITITPRNGNSLIFRNVQGHNLEIIRNEKGSFDIEAW